MRRPGCIDAVKGYLVSACLTPVSWECQEVGVVPPTPPLSFVVGSQMACCLAAEAPRVASGHGNKEVIFLPSRSAHRGRCERNPEAHFFSSPPASSSGLLWPCLPVGFAVLVVTEHLEAGGQGQGNPGCLICPVFCLVLQGDLSSGLVPVVCLTVCIYLCIW